MDFSTLLIAGAGLLLGSKLVKPEWLAKLRPLLSWLTPSGSPVPMLTDLGPVVGTLDTVKRHGLVITQEVADALVENGVEVEECKKLIDPILPKLVIYRSKK